MAIDPSEVGREDSQKESPSRSWGLLFHENQWVHSFSLHPHSPPEGYGIFLVVFIVALNAAVFIYLLVCLTWLLVHSQHLFQATCLGLTVSTWAKLSHATG